MFRPAHHGFDKIAVVEFNFERQLGEIGRGELESRLREVDAVIVADLGCAQCGLHHAGIAAGNVEERERRREDLIQRGAQESADLAMGQAVALDQLAVGCPLLLELRERRSVHDRAARLELMDVNIDQF